MKTVYLKNLLKDTETDLGDDARILFILPNGAEICVQHAGTQEAEGTLTINVRNGRMRVLPVVSNQVNIEVIDVVNARPGYRRASRKRP